MIVLTASTILAMTALSNTILIRTNANPAILPAYNVMAHFTTTVPSANPEGTLLLESVSLPTTLKAALTIPQVY